MENPLIFASSGNLPKIFRNPVDLSAICRYSLCSGETNNKTNWELMTMSTIRLSGMQAPAGGCVSEVNHQEYKGGQFVPVHGVFCGAKGKKREQKWNRYRPQIRIDLGGKKLWEVLHRSWDSGRERNFLVGAVLASTSAEAIAAVKERGPQTRPGEVWAAFGY